MLPAGVPIMLKYRTDMIENIHYLLKAIKPAGAPNIL